MLKVADSTTCRLGRCQIFFSFGWVSGICFQFGKNRGARFPFTLSGASGTRPQDTNFSLFKYNNELSAEIEKLEQQIAEYKEECARAAEKERLVRGNPNDK